MHDAYTHVHACICCSSWQGQVTSMIDAVESDAVKIMLIATTEISEVWQHKQG